MLVIIDSHILTDLCEVQLNLARMKQKVEIVVRLGENTVITKDNVYEKDKLEVRR